MADAESTGGKGLKKRVGPLSVGGWLASVGGALVVFILFKRYEADKAAAAAAGGGTGAGVLTAGGTIPAGGGSSATSGGAPFSNYAAWLTAAIAQMTSTYGIDAGTALNGVTDWLSGQCVTSTQYQAIAGVIANESIGLPPGYGQQTPNLSVCSGSPTPSSTPSLLAGQVGQGLGFTDPNMSVLTDLLGGQYFPFASPQAAIDYIEAGGTAYAEIAPGTFAPVTAANLSEFTAVDTWVYQKLGAPIPPGLTSPAGPAPAPGSVPPAPVAPSHTAATTTSGLPWLNPTLTRILTGPGQHKV